MNEEIKREDIITFEAPSVEKLAYSEYYKENPVAVYNNEPQDIFSKFTYYVLEINKTSYIKRVIGVAGDTIRIEGGKVYRNDEELDETYLPDDMQTERQGLVYDITVPEGYIYVMGDNRGDSRDSRSFGCIPIDKVESKVWIRFWPFNKMGKV